MSGTSGTNWERKGTFDMDADDSVGCARVNFRVDRSSTSREMGESVGRVIELLAVQLDQCFP